jgi:hypothetical protein
MSDSTISAVPPQPPQPQPQAAPVVVKVDAVPPQLPQNTVVSGQVVANNNNQVSIQTDQGLVILQAALDIDVGQKVNLKIQLLPQPATPPPAQGSQSQPVAQPAPNLVAELLNVSADKISPASNLAVQSPDIDITPQGVIPQKTITQQVPVDPVIVHDSTAFEEYKPLQALIIQMPDILQDDTLAVMTKSLLQLPISQPLPPSLQEGFDKFTQLTNLLSQANLLPANASETAENTGKTQQNIIPTLQQLLQPNPGKAAPFNPLLSQEPHQFIQLQTVQPGENLSPNILVNIKDQLLTLLQPQTEASTLSEKTSNLIQSLIPESLSNILDKAGTSLQAKLPQFLSPTPATSSPLSTPVLKSPLFTLPAIGLVLGLPPHEIPQFENANLVLMATPQKQDPSNPTQSSGQLIGLLAPQEDTPHTPLLPGTILVAALKPQTEKAANFAGLPEQFVEPIIDSFASLHPSLGENWPVLDDLWQQIMSQKNPDQSVAQFTNPLQQIIPSPQPQQLPPTMLFFLSLLKNDFTSSWIPEKHLAGLEKIDTAALIKTLSQDLQAIKSRMDENLPADSWRPLPVPLQVGDQLMRLQWFYRHPDASYERKPGEDEETLNKKRKTRFLLNVPKTMLGDLQIDGLVQERNLDLILRTENILPSQMETAIRGRYTAVLETTGMIGGINFQSGRAHYVHV